MLVVDTETLQLPNGLSALVRDIVVNTAQLLTVLPFVILYILVSV